jgi:predicted permease
MNWQRWRWKYWTDVFRRRQVEQELDAEIRSHVEMEVQRRMDRGEAPETARTSAMRELRSVDFVKEGAREVRAWQEIDRVMQDVRYAARMLRNSPVFTAIALLSLALGIGANTAIFTMINAVLLQTLPVRDPERLVLLTSFQRNGLVGNFAYPDYERLRDGTQVFSGVLAASRPAPINVGVNNEPQRVLVQLVSGNYFGVIGVEPRLGRMFTPQDDDEPVAVISHGYWQRTFGGDPGVIGKSVTVNGSPCRIVGVTAPDFAGETVGQATDVWVPIGMLQSVRPSAFDLKKVRFVSWLYLMGRLKPDMTIERARVEADILVARIHGEFGTNPEMDYLHHIVMEPGSRGSAGLRNGFSAVLLTLMGVVAFVLLIACTNLATLLLARAVSRQREIATRLALGAGRGRLIRQLLTESVLLAVLGGALGLLFAFWSNRFLLRQVSEGVGSITVNLYPDLRVLLFSAAVAVLTGIVFGLVPALRAARANISANLRTQSPTPSHGARLWGLRDVLLTAQVALSLVLVAGGLLFARTLWNLKTLDLGLQPGNVLLAGVGPPDQRLATDVVVRLLERASAIPGVVSASVSLNLPLGNTGSGVNGIEIPGFTPQSEEDQQARADWIGPSYFDTLAIPLVRGRAFSFADTTNSQSVVIVNETMARFYFGDRSPVGGRLRFNEKEYEIVGVVRDAKYRELRESTPRMLYFALLQNAAVGPMTLELRTSGSPLELAGAVRAALAEVDTRLTIREMTSLSGLIDRKLIPEYLIAGMSGFFSGLTLLLVCIGIYGTLGFTVSRRANEIGVRLALGAKPSRVLLMVMKDIMRPLAAGLVLGLLIVLASGPLVASLLFGLGANDPATMFFAALLLSSVALAAAYIPARRASRFDPYITLRLE